MKAIDFDKIDLDQKVISDSFKGIGIIKKIQIINGKTGKNEGIIEVKLDDGSRIMTNLKKVEPYFIKK